MPPVGPVFMARDCEHTRGEHALYCLGVAGVVAHAVDHLVSGTERTPLFLSALALTGVTVGLAVVYPWVSPRWRAVAGLGLGGMWAVTAFVHHVLPVFIGDRAPTDYTGVLASAGGIVILLAGLRALRLVAEVPRPPSRSTR